MTFLESLRHDQARTNEMIRLIEAGRMTFGFGKAETLIRLRSQLDNIEAAIAFAGH